MAARRRNAPKRRRPARPGVGELIWRVHWRVTVRDEDDRRSDIKVEASMLEVIDGALVFRSQIEWAPHILVISRCIGPMEWVAVELADPPEPPTLN